MPQALTLDGLRAVLGIMREFNVTRFKTAVDGSPLEVDFAPIEAPPSQLQPADTALKPECECSHLIADHNSEGACLHGCDANKCNV